MSRSLFSSGIQDHRNGPVSSRRWRAKPKFLEKLEATNAHVGDPVRLQCRVEGEPEPEIEWLVDGDKIKEGSRFRFMYEKPDVVALCISCATIEDEGEYTCRASNPAGSCSCTAELIVDAPAKVDQAATPGSGVVGGKITLTCLISGNPVPTATWFRGDEELKSGGRIHIETTDDRSSLTIERIQFRDEGEYELVVKNDGGEDSCVVKLTVDDDSDDEDVDPKVFDLPKKDDVYLATDKKFEQAYDSLEELGKGKFGVVKKVKDKKTGEVLAAKFIRTSSESKKEVMGEIAMMNHLHSKRLIYLADAYERPGEMIVIMEFVSGGELFEKICNDDNLTEKEVIRYMRQILQGVEHMHRKSIVHLDLKPENVLCVIRPDGKEDLKLIDFGMAHIIEKGKDLKLACGTPEFVAPEVLAYEPIKLAADMWSIGVIAYVLLSGLSPFMGDDDNETIQNVSGAEWDFEDESFEVVSDMSKKFIEELLIRDPKKRNDIYKCLGHEWLKKAHTIEAKKLSTDNLKKFLARRRWQKTANALRALSRLGSMGMGGLGAAAPGGAAPGGGAGGLLGGLKKGKVQSEEQTQRSMERLRPERESMEGVPLSGRRSPTLSGRRSPVNRERTHDVPKGPPVFKQKLKDCKIIEGSAARFECQITGNPEPEVEWYRNGELLKECKQLTFLYDENDNCKLIITEGKHADAGEYKVVAENRHGKVSCSAKLIINDPVPSDDESASDAESDISEEESEDEDKDVVLKSDAITKYYTIKDELGKGRFGVVCKCVNKKTGKQFAAKFIKCSKPQDREDVIHEMEIMNTIRHKRLLRLADAFETPSQQEMILVMELVTGGELFEKVVEEEFISENDVTHYMKQILEGLEHMHKQEVLHLDLKPENIMIVKQDSRQIKLIDFGLARKYNPKENLKVMFGTPEFVAPEVLTYDRITPATDMWSIGVIAYVLLSGLSPFMGDNDAETLANVQTAEWDFDDPVFDDISDEAKDFIEKLLVLKATARISVAKCMEHPWLTTKKETGKRIKTDRLKAFTARRKWKKALTAIRSTNFLSRILAGARATAEGEKKSGGGRGGGGGLLARVKAMHKAGVQAPESGPPTSAPFLSPASAEKKTVAESTPTSTTSNDKTHSTPAGDDKRDSASPKGNAAPPKKNAARESASSSSSEEEPEDKPPKEKAEKEEEKKPLEAKTTPNVGSGASSAFQKNTPSPSPKTTPSKPSWSRPTPAASASTSPSGTKTKSPPPVMAKRQWPPPPKEKRGGRTVISNGK